MATPPKKPTDGTTKPPAPRKPATPRKTTTTRKAAPRNAATPKTAAADASKRVRKATEKIQGTGEKALAAVETAATDAGDKVKDGVKAVTARSPAAKRSATRKTSGATSSTRSATTKRGDGGKTAGTGTGRRWGMAAAVTAAGAAITAGLFALRGSTPTTDDPAKPNEGRTAHQADGADSSRSFEAGIADEGTIPE